MDIKKMNVRLAYRIEEKPEGGFIARSDDPNVESIEAATKAELFIKMREKTSALIGKGLPLDVEHLQSTSTVVDIATKQTTIVNDARLFPSNDSAPPANQGVSTLNIWKILFFLLLAAVAVYVFMHRQ